MADLTLVIGTKTYSSWSLRPWLAMAYAGIEFDEILIPLRQPDTVANILVHSPAGKVPVLKTPRATIWESLAICEYVAEAFPDRRLWPEDVTARALARSVSAEMHSGFADLRACMPMNLQAPEPGRRRTPACEADIARVLQLWRDAKARFGADGPFLFGHFTIADAMFAPVCTRFRTYQVQLDPESQAYVDTVLALPAMQAWYEAARREPASAEPLNPI
jgi:glutathione S-transferase